MDVQLGAGLTTWIRVRDRDTGHEYDVNARDPRLRTGLWIILRNYPTNSGHGAMPRPAKHRVTKSGRPYRAATPAEPIKESDNG